MDPASLDPRLRDIGEDSIVVHHSSPDDNDNDNDNDDDDAASDRFSSEEEPDDSLPQGPLVNLTTSTKGTTSTTTPASHVFPPAPETPSAVGAGAGAVAVVIAPAPTPGSTGVATPHDPNDPKRPRACEACRGLKVKCEPDPLNPDGPCKRCAKAGRACLVTQPTRKRQKKTDSRVAELEKKIDALTASLQASRGNGTLPPPPPPPPLTSTQQPQPMRTPTPTTLAPQLHPNTNPSPQRPAVEDARIRIAKEWGPPVFPPVVNDVQDDRAAMGAHKRKFADIMDKASPSDGFTGPSPTPMLIVSRTSLQPDCVDRKVITMDEAVVLFQRYTDRMAPHLPAVVFPPGTTAADIRQAKPILFLSIMSVGSSQKPNIQRLLVKELMQVFADEIIVHGRKSLELVQSIMISVIWYFPPEHFEELKFYQLVHLAAVMAIDMGLGRRKNSPKSRLIPYTWRDHPLRKDPLPDPVAIESRRAWLAVYFLASNVAMALHRPNLIRWQSFMTECMDILESSPEAAPSDRYLCHLVWTHRLAEDVGIQFSMDDPSIFVNVTEQKVQYALRGFERDLAKYSENIPKEDKQRMHTAPTQTMRWLY